MKHLRTMDDLSNSEIYRLLNRAEEDINVSFKEKTAALLFYEPSTRTKLSFEMACHKLGIKTLNFSKETSSATKGESLYDTVKTLESIGVDFVVIRHDENHFYKELDHLSIPIINAGDGSGEHPTQSLLDLLTIKQEFQQFEELKIVICGDILHSRVAKSNASVLHRLGAEVKFVAKEEWQDHSLPFEYISMDEAVKTANVLMLLRVQKERHQQDFLANNYLEQYGLTTERERKMKPNSIIMHPAPVNRGVEIDSSLVECERSRIFKQMSNGVIVRQLIIQYLLEEGRIHHEAIN